MKFSSSIILKDLLLSVGYKGNIIGDFETLVEGLNDDFVAQPHDLTWVTSMPLLKELGNKNIPLAVITNVVPTKRVDNIVYVLSDNPISVFEKCVSKMYRSCHNEPVIGKGTVVHPSVVVGENVRIGADCCISPNVVIGDGTIIGNNVTIRANAVVGADPFFAQRNQDHSFFERQIVGNVEIFDGVQIGASTVIDRGLTSTTYIGEGTKIGNFVEIAHDVVVGKYCGFSAQVAIAGYVRIGDYCKFWGKSGVVNRINIASYTSVFAASIVTKDTKEGDNLCGFPAISKYEYWRQQARVRSLK